MEIHAPDKPIHSKKEFMFHMLTVVLGILIALALNGIVMWALIGYWCAGGAGQYCNRTVVGAEAATLWC